MSFTHSIMFHHFNSDVHLPAQGSLSAEDFDAMLAWLAARHNILDADDYVASLEEGRLKPQDVCLSFDDALLCQYDVAAPVLEARGIKAFSLFTSRCSVARQNCWRYFGTFAPATLKRLMTSTACFSAPSKTLM